MISVVPLAPCLLPPHWSWVRHIDTRTDLRRMYSHYPHQSHYTHRRAHHWTQYRGWLLDWSCVVWPSERLRWLLTALPPAHVHIGCGATSEHLCGSRYLTEVRRGDRHSAVYFWCQYYVTFNRTIFLNCFWWILYKNSSQCTILHFLA